MFSYLQKLYIIQWRCFKVFYMTEREEENWLQVSSRILSQYHNWFTLSSCRSVQDWTPDSSPGSAVSLWEHLWEFHLKIIQLFQTELSPAAAVCSRVDQTEIEPHSVFVQIKHRAENTKLKKQRSSIKLHSNKPQRPFNMTTNIWTKWSQRDMNRVKQKKCNSVRLSSLQLSAAVTNKLWNVV